ncbi:MAG TPA: 4-alpha-glucanotransferase [Acidimicrobiales bacterium]|jgi:4-alpha-glucanotransferase|nr:4-alpha-glucanotransferase [Acidimicrobiales bacterium]
MSGQGSELATLAARHRVHTRYTDVDGVTKNAADEVLVGLLQALDVPVRGPVDAGAVLRDERRAAVHRRLEPVLVYRLARPEPVAATLPAATDPQDVWLTLELEDGTTRRDTLANIETRAEGVTAVEGVRYVRHAVDLGALVIDPLPAGYHRVTLEGAGPSASALVLAAPDCPATVRSSVAFLPLHAVRSNDDWGSGSYTDLGRLGRWVSDQGVGLLGTLPLYPSFLDTEPADPSPYLPVSRLAYNELFIDPTGLPELAVTPESRHMLDADGFRTRLSALHASRLVEYEEVARLKRQVLEPMARTVYDGRFPDRLRQLRQFAQAHPELVAYARFRAAREQARTAHPGDEASAALTAYYLYCQWAAAQQLSSAGAAVGLYADFPIGSHPDGFDPHWSPPSFMSGVQGGAPPDRFFSEGQAWGFRPLHPQRMREDGYRYLIAALDRAFVHAECLRIDHVMGLERLYMIPQGFSAREGTYVSYPADELHALVCIGAARRGSTVVGEDLGTVPESVRRRMARDKMLRTWVFQFESTVAEPLPEPPRRALAALGTHDLPTFAAFLWGDDITERERSGVLSPDAATAAREERAEWRSRLLGKLGLGTGAGAPSERAGLTFQALEGCLAHLARGPAELVLVDLEDIWDERAAQNHPGTGPGAGNWRRRSARSLEEIRQDPDVAVVCHLLDRSGVAP